MKKLKPVNFPLLVSSPGEDLVGEELLLAKMRHGDYLQAPIFHAFSAPNYHTQSSQPNFTVLTLTTSKQKHNVKILEFLQR